MTAEEIQAAREKYGITPPTRSFDEAFDNYLTATLKRHPSHPSTGFVSNDDELRAWTLEAEQRDKALGDALNTPWYAFISSTTAADVGTFLGAIFLAPALLYALVAAFFWALRGFKPH